ncbi:MAG TPA: hypothetical protein VK215_06715 [Acidimicrobiales bacterium]|nr:hypothetical protein [Acidimicrobiales bacterium]HLN42126.1 hypothetical protein [Acidimicrobiales bacterium]
MRAFLDNAAVGIVVVVPLLLVVTGLLGLQAVSPDSSSFSRLRLWLTGSSAVLVVLFALVVTTRFLLR